MQENTFFFRRSVLKYLGMVSATYFQMRGKCVTIERDKVNVRALMNVGEGFKNIHCTSLSTFSKLEEKVG